MILKKEVSPVELTFLDKLIFKMLFLSVFSFAKNYLIHYWDTMILPEPYEDKPFGKVIL